MCGIGCVVCREGNALEKAKKILIGQENRGSSSSGIAFINNNKIEVVKDVKPPHEFVKNLNINSRVIITHSRAPSVGGVKIENTHPFLSCDGKFALVHNGTFLAYGLLKNLLSSDHKIKGETDSEIITHFIEEYGKLKGYKNILTSFEGQRLILLFKNKIIGRGSFYVVKDREGVYITQEKDVLVEMFENERKYCYKIDGYFEIDVESLRMEGDVKFVGRKVLKKNEENEDLKLNFFGGIYGEDDFSFY
jgi:glutamine phosphoribosylpyrophosphate amidotransferase